MVYRADKGSGNFSNSGTAFGYATNADGLNWQRGQETPILTPSDESVWSTLWSAGFVYQDGTY